MQRRSGAQPHRIQSGRFGDRFTHHLRSHTVARLESEILLLYTGISRSASTLLRQQADGVAGSGEKQRSMMRMVELAYQLRTELQRN